MSSTVIRPAALASLWLKSSFCQSASCVELALLDGLVGVRDSKLENSPVLMYTKEEFAAFVRGAKAGEFDHFC